MYYNKVGDALYRQKKYDDAESFYREAVRLKPRDTMFKVNVRNAIKMRLRLNDKQTP